MALLVQVGVIALIAAVAMAIFRRRSPAPAGAGAPGTGPASHYDFQRPAQPMQPAYAPHAAPAAEGGDEIGLGQGDLDAFEQLLGEVQSAFGREDYAALRERTTPEIMSYLAEELSQNAVSGRRNDVTDVRLLQGDVSEAWREDARDYATVAMRYSSVDVMRDRSTGQLVEGDERPTETTELWTFVRDRAGPWGAGWKLSAIQELEPAAA
jgi:predicted lipid-binding transport protein (Tim44 family)